jgi:hypothetical protein
LIGCFGAVLLAISSNFYRTAVIKGLNFQVLLDPLEKKFYLPAAAVEFGYLQGRQVQAVG